MFILAGIVIALSIAAALPACTKEPTAPQCQSVTEYMFFQDEAGNYTQKHLSYYNPQVCGEDLVRYKSYKSPDTACNYVLIREFK